MKNKIPTYIVIPGFGESRSDAEYKTLEKKLKATSAVVVKFYNPIWDRRTIKHWLSDFEKEFSVNNLGDTILVGFSMGSLIALMLAEKFNFKKVLLASLSPYFKNNIKDIPAEASNFFGKNRMAAFSELRRPEKIKCKSIFLFGDQDWPIAISQARELASLYKGKFILVKDTPHELTVEYIRIITVEA